MSSKMPEAPAQSDVQAFLSDLMSKAKEESTTYSCLLQSTPGGGKTHMLATLPKPLLIHMFDPKGDVVLRSKFSEEIESGQIVIRKFPIDLKDPAPCYTAWEKEWEQLISTGAINYFASFAIDTLTNWMTLAAAAWLFKKNKQRGSGKHLDGLAQGDYQGLYAITKNMVLVSSSQDCHFVLTGHLEAEKDEFTGKIRHKLSTFNKLKSELPALFADKLVIVKKPSSNGVKYELLTVDKGLYEASTQFANLEPVEEPNFKTLIKKAGLPIEDKPAIK